MIKKGDYIRFNDNTEIREELHWTEHLVIDIDSNNDPVIYYMDTNCHIREEYIDSYRADVDRYIQNLFENLK